MKRLWILNHYAQHPGGPGGTRHFHLAKYMSKYGWKTTILAASTELNTGRQRLADSEKQRLEEIDGIPFLWVKTPAYSGNGAGRILNMLAFTFRVLLPGSTKSLERPDAIIGSSVHPFAAWSGKVLARRFGVPFLFEVRDLWPQTLIDMGQLKEGSFPDRLLKKLELHLFRNASAIITVLPKAHEYIVPLGIARERVVWLPNGVDMELFPSDPHRKSDNKHFTVMYLGSHGQANGLSTILHAMKRVQDNQDVDSEKPILLRMIGDGPLKEHLRKEAAVLGLLNVVFEDSVPKSRIPEIASEADAFVISVRDLPGLYRYGFSMNKLFDYMASARPTIIATDVADNAISLSGSGIAVPAEDPEALASAMRELSTCSDEELANMGHKGRKYVDEHHSFDHLAKRLADTLNNLPVSR